MRVPPELCFYFISVPRLLITKSAKLKDAGAERLVAAPAGKSLCIFYFFWCGVAPSSEHLAQRRRSAWCLLTRPFRSLLIRASQLETTLILCSNQPSSVIFRRLHSGLYPASTFGLYKTTGAAPWRERRHLCCLCVHDVFLGGCFRDLCEILTLRRHCNERQWNISLIISNMISCQWAVPDMV